MAWEPAPTTEDTPSTKPSEIMSDAKESEPITSSTSTTETSTTEQATKSLRNESELLEEGNTLLKAEQFDKACNALSDALGVLQQKDMANGIQSVDYYIAYGTALLRLAQSSNDLFGAAVKESQNAQNEASNPSNDSNGHSKEEQDDPQIPDQSDEPNQAGPEPEDREIAWETFEYARTILEECIKDSDGNCDEYLKKLASVHSFLGEICIEDENNKAALVEFESALKLQGQCSEGAVACRELATNHYWACLAAQCSDQLDEALKHCQTSLQVLSDTIKALCGKFQPDEECKSSEEVISAAEAVIATLSVEQKETEDGKELVALVGVMTELRETKEEVERLIERKNNPEPAATGNEQPVEEMDPMQAMINSLVAACAIPEEELAKMDKMEQEQQAQNGNGNSNSNSNSNAPKEGVTTIGFGNQNDDGDDEVHEVMVVKTKRRKRNLQQAGIEDVEEEAKKMKLNTGTAKKTETAKE